MGDSPSFGNTVQQAAYLRFLRSALLNDQLAVRNSVDADAFAAFLPGQGRLALDQFRRLMAGLRETAPEFGENVTVLKWLEQDGLLCVMHRMVYTIVGRRVEYTSTDWMSFDNAGRITELRVFYDLADTREQVFGTQLRLP